MDRTSEAPDPLKWDPTRDLPLHVLDSNLMSPALCITRCRRGNATHPAPFAFAGVQNKLGCFCGDRFGRYGPAPPSECNMPCPHLPGIACGGYKRHDVYSTNVTAAASV